MYFKNHESPRNFIGLFAQRIGCLPVLYLKRRENGGLRLPSVNFISRSQWTKNRCFGWRKRLDYSRVLTIVYDSFFIMLFPSSVRREDSKDLR
jgi:hypothetical protein